MFIFAGKLIGQLWRLIIKEKMHMEKKKLKHKSKKTKENKEYTPNSLSLFSATPPLITRIFQLFLSAFSQIHSRDKAFMLTIVFFFYYLHIHWENFLLSLLFKFSVLPIFSIFWNLLNNILNLETFLVSSGPNMYLKKM